MTWIVPHHEGAVGSPETAGTGGLIVFESHQDKQKCLGSLGFCMFWASKDPVSPFMPVASPTAEQRPGTESL